MGNKNATPSKKAPTPSKRSTEDERKRDLEATYSLLSGAGSETPDSETPGSLTPADPGSVTPRDGSVTPADPGSVTPRDGSVTPADPGSVTPRDGSVTPADPGSVTPRDGSVTPADPGSVTPRDGSVTPRDADSETPNETEVESEGSKQENESKNLLDKEGCSSDNLTSPSGNEDHLHALVEDMIINNPPPTEKHDVDVPEETARDGESCSVSCQTPPDIGSEPEICGEPEDLGVKPDDPTPKIPSNLCHKCSGEKCKADCEGDSNVEGDEVSTPKTYRCPVCARVFDGQKKLRIHIKVHTDPDRPRGSPISPMKIPGAQPELNCTKCGGELDSCDSYDPEKEDSDEPCIPLKCQSCCRMYRSKLQIEAQRCKSGSI